MNHFRIVKSFKLPDRFIIIDNHTGKVLDDAQGYGYKTPQKAYACWKYKYGGFEKEFIINHTF